MAALTSSRLRWMRTTGKFQSASKIEAQRNGLIQQLERYRAFENSETGKRYYQLLKFAQSGEPERIRHQCNLEVFNGSKEQGMIADLKNLKRNPDVRAALKGKGDTNAPAFRKYQQLQDQINSNEFKERVDYLKNSKKYQLTEAFRNEKELKSIAASHECKWYLKQQKKGNLAELAKEQVLFFDDFDAQKLNTKLWTPRFFWGDALLQQPHSFLGDPHGYTDGKNISLQNGCLVIETRQENFQSLAWNAKLGFLPKNFHYTAGVLTTGTSFRMQHGIFEAKIRITAPVGVYHAIYMVGEKSTPQVDLFRTDPEQNRVISAVFTPNERAEPTTESIGPLPFPNEFFILKIEWTAQGMTWYINNLPYMEQRVNLPNEPLYLVMLSGVKGEPQLQQPARMEIDWVRCSALKN